MSYAKLSSARQRALFFLLTVAILFTAKSERNTKGEILLNVTRPLTTRRSFPPVLLDQFTCATGHPPWSMLDPYEELEIFSEVFSRRPGDGVNKDGASFFHYFALWCTVKALRPEVIIESGINKGVGSWFLRQAAGPKTKMIFISPQDPSDYRDTRESTLYFTEKEFKDFSEVDWDRILTVEARRRAFIFFDDHQSGFRRAIEARRLLFQHIMIDDNYLPGAGDNFSPKMACRASIFSTLGVKMAFLDNFGKVKEPISAAQYFDIQVEFDNSVSVYAEFPPVWSGPTRFHVEQKIHDRLTVGPLFQREEVAHLSLDLDEEAKRYTHIAYLHLTDFSDEQ
jgi:hypothetical protein